MSYVSIASQFYCLIDGGDLTILFAAFLVCCRHRLSDRGRELSVDLALGFVDIADSLLSKIVESRLEDNYIVVQSGDT